MASGNFCEILNLRKDCHSLSSYDALSLASGANMRRREFITLLGGVAANAFSRHSCVLAFHHIFELQFIFGSKCNSFSFSVRLWLIGLVCNLFDFRTERTVQRSDEDFGYSAAQRSCTTVSPIARLKSK
jgi:hypothetical protein